MHRMPKIHVRKETCMNELECLKELYEKSEDPVYILEEETGRLAWTNAAGRKMDGLDPDSYAGQNIEQLLPQRTEYLCETQAQMGTFHNRVSIDPHTDQIIRMENCLIRCEDTVYRVVILQDAEPEKISMADHEVIIDHALELIMDEDNPERAIRRFLRYIGTQLHCERTYIFEDSHDGTFANTYEWCRKGVKPLQDRRQAVPREFITDVWNRQFSDRHGIVFCDAEEYRHTDTGIYQILKRQGIRTLAAGPICIGHERTGFYGADNVPLENREDVTLLYDVLARFMAALIKRRNDERVLYHDELTGMYNRAYLSRYLQKKNSGVTTTFYFVDINNLKAVNDQKGHAAGDELIRSTAKLLSDFVSPAPVIRMGGDEFLALCDGLSEEESMRKEKELHACFEANAVSAAVGRVWQMEELDSFAELFKEADRRMYDDKQRMHMQMQAE